VIATIAKRKRRKGKIESKRIDFDKGTEQNRAKRNSFVCVWKVMRDEMGCVGKQGKIIAVVKVFVGSGKQKRNRMDRRNDQS
jgi:hypothetical protein